MIRCIVFDGIKTNFFFLNQGKRSLTLDLKHLRVFEVFERLVAARVLASTTRTALVKWADI